MDKATQRQATKRAAIKRATELGVTLDIGHVGRCFEVTMDAPKLKRFRSTRNHSIVHSAYTATSVTLWSDVLEDLECGLVDCASDCEYCTDLEHQGGR